MSKLERDLNDEREKTLIYIHDLSEVQWRGREGGRE